MIDNIDHIVCSPMDFLKTSEFIFSLTGSRLFGGATESSDWDFFVQDSPKVQQALRNNGFHQLDSYSCDESRKALNQDRAIVCVYRFQSDSIQIDVQVVDDFALRKRIVLLIQTSGRIKDIPKPNRPLIWNVAYSAYKLGAQKKSSRFWGKK